MMKTAPSTWLQVEAWWCNQRQREDVEPAERVMIGMWVWSRDDTSKTNQTQPQKPDPTEFGF